MPARVNSRAVAGMTIEDEQQFTRESAERYDPRIAQGQMIAVEHQARYRWAAMAASGKEILDAGCGVGYGSAMLADAEATRVVGVDIDPAAIADASSRYGARDAVEFFQGDLLELPFDDSSFDLVVCFEAIEHIDRQDAALDELRRVLRDEGHVLLSSPNRDVYPPGNPHHVHEYTPEELGEALAKRFGDVDLWRQHTWLASLLMNDASAAAGPETEVDTSVRKLTALDPGSELYTLAIAGKTRLSGLRGSTMLGEPIEIRELVLLQQELEERTQEMYAARRETADTIAGFEGSFSWRVTKPLRGAKRLVERVGRRSNPD
jgi:ubiquinone/menaquinone biosynthesis C-methylase UbiE